jgi:ABC-2 type transport system ATP-binding protein
MGGRMTAQTATSVPTSRSATVTAAKVIGQSGSIILVKDLVKVFEPDVRAVDGISFDVHRGEIFGFLGPNGAGKTTTIKVITTLLRKTSGSAVVDGINVDEHPANIRKIIGYAAQEVGIDDDLTGRENLRLQCALYHVPKSEVPGRVAELLKAIDLEDAADRRAGTYSGGMRKRLDLAMALIPRPKVLFLDEPTTGLDPQNRAAVWEYIRKLNDEGTTIFLTTQYMEEADRLADRLCIIDHGHIMAEGTPASLKASIGADVVSLSFKENGQSDPRAAAKAALSKLSGIHEIQEVVDGGIAVYAPDAPALVPQIVLALNDAHVDIAELTLTHPTLDDVFMKYTGRKMRAEEVTPPRRTPWGARRRRPM